MKRCFGCGKLIWPWQGTGFNSIWHRGCAVIWDKGYKVAFDFCTKENKIHQLPTPTQLYNRRGSIGEILPEDQWRGDQTMGLGG